MVQLRNNFAFGLGRGEVTQGKRTREKRKKEGESGDEERATMGKLGGNTQMRESFCPLSSSRPVTEPVCKTGMPPTIPPGHWKLSPPPLPPPPPSPGYLFRRIKSHSPPFLIWGSPTICGDFPSPRGPSFPHWESSSLAVRCRPSCKVGEQILRWLCCGCNTFKCTWTVKHFHLGGRGDHRVKAPRVLSFPLTAALSRLLSKTSPCRGRAGVVHRAQAGWEGCNQGLAL